MPTFKYAKLVRDNIWEWHEEKGHVVKGEKLRGAELRKALCNKLHEEADEVNGALSKEELIEEIADVQQIIDDLCTEENITHDDIAKVQRRKAERKGGFQKGHYIETVTISNKNDRWAQYCLKSPEKYPQVDQHGHVSPDLPFIDPGIYKHSKRGHLYEVIGVALQTETNEPLVLYKPLYENKYDYFARPYAMFTETTEINGQTVPRFEKTKE